MFAPKLKIKAPDGTSKGVQQFLQDAFLDMYAVVASTLGDVEGVLGFEASVYVVWLTRLDIHPCTDNE